LDIPLHYHIIHDGETNKVKKSQINAQTEVLTNSFKAHGLFFHVASTSYIDDAEMLENCGTKGAVADAIHSALAVNPGLSLNIYICKMSQAGSG